MTKVIHRETRFVIGHFKPVVILREPGGMNAVVGFQDGPYRSGLGNGCRDESDGHLDELLSAVGAFQHNCEYNPCQ